ncbi:MAG: ETC complex I subunit [Rhodospirillaceae bacterium]|nr:ETC complex I subunit [Rhodospirillaceae bacterium]
MSTARIYRPRKTAMQSGRARTKSWMLEFEPAAAKRPDRLMGWVSSSDMMGDEVRIRFASKDEAVAFAERYGIEFRVQVQIDRDIKPKSYADNFRPERTSGNWTH